MGYHLSFCNLLQVVGSLILNGGKLEKTLDEGLTVIISCEADTSIIKVILPSRSEHLDNIVVHNSITSIIARGGGFLGIHLHYLTSEGP